MIAYIGVYLLIVLLSYFKLRNKIIYNRICFFIFFLFMGFRYDVGWDFRWYYRFGKLIELRNYSIFSTLEILEKWDVNIFQFIRLEFFNKIIYKIVWYLEEPQLVFLIYAFLLLIFLKKGLDNQNKQTVYPWILFYSIPIFFFYFTSLVRQAVAVSIVFYSYKYIKERLFFKYTIAITLASLFHSTALFIFPIYYLYNIKLNKLKLILIYFSSFFITDLLIVILKTGLFSKYKSYIINAKGEGGRIIYFLVILIGIWILCFYKKLIKNEENIFFMNMVILGCSIYISLISLGHLGQRMSVYFIFYILYIIDDFINLFKNKNIIKFIFFVINGILLILILYGDSINPKRTQYIPYRVNFFNKI